MSMPQNLPIRIFRKWWAVLGISFQESIAYRASMLIWIVTDIVPALTMPLVWASAASNGRIAGYSTSDFVLYYLSMLLLSCFITSHLMWDIANEIRDGVFSTAILRPISYFQLSFFRNLSWRVIRILIFTPFFLLIALTYRQFISGAELNLSFSFWLSVALGHTLSFVSVMAMSLLAFFTQEAMSVFELYYGPMLFLSGQLFPVSLLPAWARELSHWLPFYYTTGVPTEILIGRLKGEAALNCIYVQIIWILASYVIFKILWKNGLKHYTGVGM